MQELIDILGDEATAQQVVKTLIDYEKALTCTGFCFNDDTTLNAAKATIAQPIDQALSAVPTKIDIPQSPVPFLINGNP